jgi:hypothetical protein
MRVPPELPAARDELAPDEQLTLAEIVNRVLDRGAVLSGEVTISVAGVDLVYLGLHVILTSVESARGRLGFPGLPPR